MPPRLRSERQRGRLAEQEQPAGKKTAGGGDRVAPAVGVANQEQPEVVQLYDEGNAGNSTHTHNAFESLFGKNGRSKSN